MHKLSLYRVRAISPDTACKKVEMMLNASNYEFDPSSLSINTINAIKKTVLFEEEFDGNIEECLKRIFDTEDFIAHEFEIELIKLGFIKEADEILTIYGNLMDNSTFYSHSIIGCLNESNESYIYDNSECIRWNPENYTIDELNKLYHEEFGNFNVLTDLNEIEPDDDDNSISLWELNYDLEKGDIYIVFTDTKI